LYSINGGYRTIIDNFINTFTPLLDTTKINNLARASNFLIRKSKLSPTLFLDLMFYGVDAELKSLNQLSQSTYYDNSLTISKQAIDSRFSPASVAFVKGLLQACISSQVCESIDASELQLFRTVRIKDSTTFELHDSLAETLEGFGKGGGPNSLAGATIQYEFDIKNGKVFDIDLKPAIQSDSKDAVQKEADLEKHDLIIRDLGYYSGEIIDRYIEREAFFISKLYHNVSVRLNEHDKNKIDFRALYSQMLKSGDSHLDLNVFIGKKKQPVRLVAALVPQDVYEKRISKKNRENKSLGYATSDEFKSRAHFNFYICNIPPAACAWDTICKLYRIRWQIELIFKVWKSIMNIDQFRKMKSARLLTTLYVKLLWVFLNWQVVSDCKNLYFRTNKKLLSIFKCFQTLKGKSTELRRCLLGGKQGIRATLLKIIATFQVRHCVEKRKQRCNIEDIYWLIFCKSTDSDYI
jgi:hypothetical protein